LSAPSKIEDTSWIKPGKCMWDWRVWGYETETGFRYELDTKSHLRFIDFAAENNIKYLLMDADWYGSEFSTTSDPTSANEKVDIQKNMAYAKSKGVGIILYLNDVGAKKFGLERVIKQFADWGASGVKYGFMKNQGQEKVQYTRKVVELCAKYKLLVDFHDGPVPPSGDCRTWPNLITREYCHSQADAKRSYWPETAVASPFINGLTGSLDLCGGWYDLEGAESRVKVFEPIPGTVAAENAKLVVNYSGLSVLADSPEEYMKKPDLFQFIRVLPDSFDEIKVLNDVIRESITVARRSGDQWFVGSLTNRDARTLKIPLGFLAPDTKYEVILYEDAPDTHFTDNKEAYS
ncbi:MAG: glycoside hydrolase family 97 catalytic domain-containing protein, partial [Cyclobacteriaceae bacterium]|nr:glycoside hydrolase family 97 catalytic domain-containing protein [Cyclobacteriaceae bacterium]